MDFTLKGSGIQENVEAQVDPTFGSLRVTPRPLEWNAIGSAGGGHYFASGASGALTGVGANGPIFSLRWTDTSHYLVLKRASIVYYLTTAYTTAQMNDFDLVRVTGFTVSDTGGNAIVPLAKRNANMGRNSLAGDVRMSSTGALSAGTRTIDGTSLRYVADGPPNVAIPTATLAVARQELVLYDNKEFAVHPIVLGANEGFLIRAVSAMGAVGVMKAYIQAEWAEVAQF